MASDRDVGGYFDVQAAGYTSSTAGMQYHHHATARIIDAGVRGDVLTVGGIWKYANVGGVDGRVVVADLSREMLGTYASLGADRLQADATALPFAGGEFDHVVLPLVVHHVAGDSLAEAVDGARAVLTEVRRVLRPGGQVWISEFCLPGWVYAVERAAVPVTRRFLWLFGTPLVVMHSLPFYERTLRELGFSAVTARAIAPPDATPWDWITPIIGVRFIKVPRFAYPAYPTLITARAG